MQSEGTGFYILSYEADSGRKQCAAKTGIEGLDTYIRPKMRCTQGNTKAHHTDHDNIGFCIKEAQDMHTIFCIGKNALYAYESAF